MIITCCDCGIDRWFDKNVPDGKNLLRIYGWRELRVNDEIKHRCSTCDKKARGEEESVENTNNQGQRLLESDLTGNGNGQALVSASQIGQTVTIDAVIIEKVETDNIKKTTWEQSLKYAFSQEELLQFGKNLSSLLKEKASLELELNAVKKQIGAKIAGVEANCQTTSSYIRDGFEYRLVKTETVFNYTQRSVMTTRLDTGEIIEDRKMRESEAQVEMKLN